MAKCRNCGTNVGCGCNLTGGLCAGCVSKVNNKTTQEEVKPPITKFSKN